MSSPGRYHLYTGSAPPPKGYTLEWLSLLRHYGTPTRLLDFSYSFFMATFFAVEGGEGPVAVWALNATLLQNLADIYISTSIPDGSTLIKEYLDKRDEEPFRALFMSSHVPFVYLANPSRLNERLTIQQGLFLASGDVKLTFNENLAEIPRHSECLSLIVIEKSARNEIRQKLFRMGINTASLYPGLEGFARSLRAKALILRNLPPQGVEMLRRV